MRELEDASGELADYLLVWDDPPAGHGLGVVDQLRVLKSNKRELESFEFIVQKVNNHLVARNYEEAAMAYEGEGLYEAAGIIRDRGRVLRTVDLNDLFDKIHREGLAINYKCPTCHAPINRATQRPQRA